MPRERELRDLAEGYIEEAKSFREYHREDRAIQLFQQALRIFEDIGDIESQIRVYVSLSVCYAVNGQKDLSVDIMLKTLDLAIRNKFYFAEIRVLNNLSDILMQYKEFERALPILLRAAERLKEDELKKTEGYNLISMAIYMNITLCYIQIKDYKQAEAFLRKSWEQAAYVDDEGYVASIRLIECLIHLGKGDRNFIETHIDDVIDALSKEDKSSDIQENINYLVEITSTLNDFDRWRKVLEIYEKFAESQDQPYFYMISSDMWIEYYKATGDHVKEAESNIEYHIFSKKHYGDIIKESAKALDDRLQLQLSIIENEEDYLAGQRDLLTGVGNEKKLQNDFGNLMKELADTEVNIGIGIIDVEDFSKYNKTRGYLGGDELLKRIAGLLKENMGEYGAVYRTIGDSFVLMLTDCSESTIKQLAETLKSVIPVPVSQGYIFMSCENQLPLEEYLEKATHALEVSRRKGSGETTIIEANIKNYHEFYRRYRSNMEEALVLEDSYRHAEDKTEWMLNLSQRRMRNQELFAENERLINRFLTPLFDGTEPLTDEIAVALANEIWDMRNEGVMENFIMLQVAELIEDFLGQSQHSEEHIYMLIVLGEGYHKFNVENYRRKGRSFYNKLDVYGNYLPTIDSIKLRRTLFETYLNASVAYAEDATTTLGKNLKRIHQIIEYYDDPTIKEALRFTKPEKEAIFDEYVIHSLGASLIYMHEEDADMDNLLAAYKLAHEIYERHVAKVGNALDINDRLHAVHERLRWLTGQISLGDCYYAHKAYFEHCDRTVQLEELSTALNTTVGFRMMVYYIPELFLMNSMGNEEFQKMEKPFLDSLLNVYLEYTNALPKGQREAGLTLELYRSFSRMIRYLPEWVDVLDLIFKVLIERNIDNSIHSRMVSEISKLILESIYREKPSLLVGYFGFKDNEEVYDGYEIASKYIENAGLIHDIGKIETNDIMSQQIRHITDMEFELIKRHPISGVKMVENSPAMVQYIPVIVGHHKFFDDTMGYPDNYKYTDHDMQLLVNIIQIADTIDAATDHIGRTYSRPKSLHEISAEFESLKGTRYSKELIEVMRGDEIFAEKITYLITDGREDICYEVFNNMSKLKDE